MYPPFHEDSSLIRDALFYERTQPKTQKMKGIDTFLEPFQMIISELKIDLKKWEIILSENVINLTGNKDHPNACFCYMLYCLTIGKILQPFLLHRPPNESFDLRIREKGLVSPTPTPSNSESSDSPSPTPNQGMENDVVNNYTLDPIPYMNQLPPIEGGESPEFKHTKGLFKCLFHFLTKKK
ncbi:hypothetical protein Tco_0905121 [Tanacetum coccineum]